MRENIHGEAEQLLADLAIGDFLAVRGQLFSRAPLSACALVAEVLRTLHDSDSHLDAQAFTDRLNSWAGGAL